MIDTANDTRRRDDAPETFNDEQDDDEREQAQSVAREAHSKDAEASPLDSEKAHGGIDGNDEAQDLVDKMRDMEQSGRIDMGAYKGEPNLDDENEKYGDEDDDEDEDE